jgi:phosphopantothenoylcysteine decarboxylase / phosphopantothenate---cysteine ligase
MTSLEPLNIIVTAGPTREPIDKIRFISNYSTGLIGYSIAEEAARRGHKIILISGPTYLKSLKSIKRINVLTTEDMQNEINKRFKWCNCLIMSAAVSDYRPQKRIPGKLKKKSLYFSLKLIKNPDILEELGKKKRDRILVGFALEKDKLIANAKKKLKEKNLDLIVANRLKQTMAPFGNNIIEAYIIDKKLKVKKLDKISKKRLSRQLIDTIEKLCYTKYRT